VFVRIKPGLTRSKRTCAQQGFPTFFTALWILLPGVTVEGHMTKKDKIAFIKSSKRKTHVYNNLERYTEQQLNDVIREIVQGLIRESEIIANAYINGYR
jgi:hypothetical protein